MTESQEPSVLHSDAHCACGHANFSIDGPALLRAFCHCSICQAFNDAPFSDITLFRRRHVTMPEDTTVSYRNYMSPAMVFRGSCTKCHTPAVEYLSMPLIPEVVIVPSANVVNGGLLPAPSLHIFYGSRVADIDDNLPRHAGFIGSQTAFGWHLMKAFLKS